MLIELGYSLIIIQFIGIIYLYNKSSKINKKHSLFIIDNLLTAQNQLNISRDLYKETIDAIPFAICMLSMDGTVNFINHKFQIMMDLPFNHILHSRIENMPDVITYANKQTFNYTFASDICLTFIVIHVKKQLDGQEYVLLIEKF